MQHWQLESENSSLLWTDVRGIDSSLNTKELWKRFYKLTKTAPGHVLAGNVTTGKFNAHYAAKSTDPKY